MTDCVIRDLRLDETDTAAEFFHEWWRANHVFYRRRDLLLWQYRQNPYAQRFSNGLTFKAAFERDNLIGVLGYMPFAFNFYGKRRWGCYLSAWWVHPDHRRGPTGMMLLHELQYRSGFDACVAGMNTPVAERLYETMGWVVIRSIPRAVAPLDQSRFLMILGPGTPGAKQIAAERIAAAQELSLLPKDREVDVFRLESFTNLNQMGWNDFYWKTFAPLYMGPAREVDYLVWRYQEIPLFDYLALAASKNGDVSGLLVYRIEQIRDREEKVARIVDLVGDSASASAMLEQAVATARSENCLMIDCFYTHPMYTEVLREHGFLDAMDDTRERYWCPHLFQPLDRSRDRLNASWWINDFDLSNTQARREFFLMKGDYEFDRPN